MPCHIRRIPNLDPFTLRTQSESFALGRSFDLMVQALGGDRDRVGDAIYGALTGALVTMKDQRFKPRLQHTNTNAAVISRNREIEYNNLHMPVPTLFHLVFIFMSCLSSSCKETSHVPEQRCASANWLETSISMLLTNESEIPPP